MLRASHPIGEQLDRLLERNAELLVALRRATAQRHALDPQHDHAVAWTACAHLDCQKVQALVDDRRPPVLQVG
jgi:hypothetical protein